MHKSLRLSKSERARQRRAKIKEIIDIKINNLYSRLHRLRIKRQKSKIT